MVQGLDRASDRRGLLLGKSPVILLVELIGGLCIRTYVVDEVYVEGMYYCRVCTLIGIYSVIITGGRLYGCIQLIDVAIPHLDSFLCKL